MTRLIDKDALVALIESYKDNFCDRNGYLEDSETNGLAYDTLCDLEDSIDSLEVKEVDDELQGIEKEVAEDRVNAIDRKRIPIVLKGKMKVKFKNEFNTLWQTVDGIQFANVAKHIIERLCLHFAAWGVYNLKGYCSISSEEKHKMDIEMKEVDLEKHLKEDIEVIFFDLDGIAVEDVKDIARHFFELGLKAKGE